MKRKILVTGGEGRFAKVLKTKNKKLNLIFVNKKYCNILDEYSLEKCIKKYRPKYTPRTLKMHTVLVPKNTHHNAPTKYTPNFVKIHQKYNT